MPGSVPCKAVCGLRRRAVGLVVTAALAAAACGGSPTPREPETRDAAAPVAVTTAAVTDGDVPSTFEAGGVVRARSTAVIAARVMAPVLDVHVRAGDRIRRGATLVTLDGREMRAHVARGKASLQAADEATVAATAQIAAAEAGVTLARATFDRISGLYAKQSATPQELDQATAALRAAEAQVAGARAQSLAAGSARDAARAGAEAADIGLSYTILTAPFDGVVASRSVDAGALASPGAPLLMLEENGPMRLEVTVDEARAGGLTTGLSVDIRLDSSRGSDGRWMRGSLAEIGRLDATTHTFVVKIDLPGDANPLQGVRHPRSGTFGRARFAAASRRAVTVPSSSLVRRGQLTLAFVVEDGVRARLRPVTPGPAVGGVAEVLAGLVAGEVVVVTPPDSMRDGSPVVVGAAPRRVVQGDR